MANPVQFTTKNDYRYAIPVEMKMVGLFQGSTEPYQVSTPGRRGQALQGH